MLRKIFLSVALIASGLIVYQVIDSYQFTYNPPPHKRNNPVAETPQAHCLKRCLKDNTTLMDKKTCSRDCEAMTYHQGAAICRKLEERCLDKQGLLKRCTAEYWECMQGARVLKNTRH